MIKINIVPVVLCGGAGSRLWPLSRTDFPKQFTSPLINTHTLFQQTLLRLDNLSSAEIKSENLIVVTNDNYQYLAKNQFDQIKSNIKNQIKFLLEAEKKNTLAAATLAAFSCSNNINLADNYDPVLIFSPADHLIKDELKFIESIKKASIKAFYDGGIVMLGIKPTAPEDGYGYIKVKSNKDENGYYKIEEFTEKPIKTQAEEYLKTNDYFWNSGIYISRLSVWMKAVESISNESYSLCKNIWQKENYQEIIDGTYYIKFDSPSFNKLKDESIDHGLIQIYCQKKEPSYMLSIDVGWSDLGTWKSVWEHSRKDDFNNSICGNVLVNKTQKSLIYASSRHVCIHGMDDLMVIEMPDVVFISKLQDSLKVKDFNGTQLEKQISNINTYQKIIKPWGWFETLYESDNQKIKKIVVNPNGKLSLQKHKFRSEYWFITKGEGTVQVDKKIQTLKVNESIFINKNQIHRLSNLTNNHLEIIEIQNGSYLGEDDIERLEDQYNRK